MKRYSRNNFFFLDKLNLINKESISSSLETTLLDLSYLHHQDQEAGIHNAHFLAVQEKENNLK